MVIQCTYNYDKFHYDESNREVKQKYVRILAESINQLDLTQYQPIIVEEETYNIIDGQHRFEACKMLHKPIYYTIIPRELADNAMITLNQYQRQWRQEEFLRYHANTEKGCYKELYDFWKNNGLPISNAAVIYPQKQINAKQIRLGRKKWNKNPHADAIVAFLEDDRLRMLPRKVWNTRSFTLAVRKAFEIYTPKQLEKLLANAIKIPHCADYEQYLTVFKNIIKPR